jgi:hypothetical protein
MVLSFQSVLLHCSVWGGGAKRPVAAIQYGRID